MEIALLSAVNVTQVGRRSVRGARCWRSGPRAGRRRGEGACGPNGRFPPRSEAPLAEAVRPDRGPAFGRGRIADVHHHGRAAAVLGNLLESRRPRGFAGTNSSVAVMNPESGNASGTFRGCAYPPSAHRRRTPLHRLSPPLPGLSAGCAKKLRTCRLTGSLWREEEFDPSASRPIGGSKICALDTSSEARALGAPHDAGGGRSRPMTALAVSPSSTRVGIC